LGDWALSRASRKAAREARTLADAPRVATVWPWQARRSGQTFRAFIQINVLPKAR